MSDQYNSSDDETYNYDSMVNTFKQRYIDEQEELKREEENIINNILAEKTQDDDDNYTSAIENILKSTSNDMKSDFDPSKLKKVNNILGTSLDNKSNINNYKKHSSNKLKSDDGETKLSIIEYENIYSNQTKPQIVKTFYMDFYKIDIERETLKQILWTLNGYSYFAPSKINRKSLKKNVYYLSYSKYSEQPKLMNGILVWIGNNKSVICYQGSKWSILNSRPMFMKNESLEEINNNI